jgi:TetR/AcrR family transcriptional repressor of multidrug resistance operon
MRTRNIDKQQLVKQKAIELLVKDGFEGFSINKLAKACGISVATLYIYYKDRDDLILRIGIEEAERFTQETTMAQTLATTDE